MSDEPRTDADILAWRAFTERFADIPDPVRNQDSIDIIREAFASGWNAGVAEAAEQARAEAAERVRAVPAVHIINTDYVPTFKRRANQCVDRFAVLRAVLDQPPVKVPDEPEPKRSGAGDGQGLIA